VFPGEGRGVLHGAQYSLLCLSVDAQAGLESVGGGWEKWCQLFSMEIGVGRLSMG
jgi:hypothetical protein